MKSFLLSDLLKNIVDNSLISSSAVISSVTNDSRNVTQGALFLAYPGIQTDGRRYINDAVKKGAAAICYESNDTHTPIYAAIPCIPVANLKKTETMIALRFYRQTSLHLPIIGVTGTNGKTSTTQFIGQSFGNSLPCGVIGTIGYGFLPQLHKAKNTTPDVLQLHTMIAELVDHGARAIAMEVSSHGLAEDRVSGIPFHTAVFTNLSRDHLDFHGTMENYAIAKSLLFQKKHLKNAVINADDSFGEFMMKQCQSHCHVLTFSMKEKTKADIFLLNAKPIKNGYHLKVNTPRGIISFDCPLFAEFNIQNVLATLSVLCIFEFSLDEIAVRLSQLKPVCGRMETFQHAGLPAVVVDYAHTPDALHKVLVTLRAHCKGRLWCVFGCGGDRDRGKRSEMGAIAELLADQIVLTNDNPRHESPIQIVNDILMGIQYPKSVKIELDRKLAIEKVISNASEEDIILIAGKGHETEQIEGDVVMPFSDSQQVLYQIKCRRQHT